MKLFSRLSLLLLLAPPLAAADRFELKTLGKLVGVSDPQIAPDGKTIVIVVSRVNYADNRHDPQLVSVDVQSRARRVLSDRRGLSAPRFSGSGDRLAYLAPLDGKPQVFVLPLAGGEALQVTKSPTGVQQYAWSPDGKQIAYAAADEAVPRTGEEKANDSFEVENDDFLITAPPPASHLWLVSSEGGAARRVSAGSWSLPVTKPPGSPSSPLSWSPDGKSIAIVKVVTPHSGDRDRSAIQIVDVATGTLRPLTGATRGEGYPTYSPDGKLIAYWSPRDGARRNGNDIHVVSAAGGQGTNLTRAIDRNLARSLWNADSQSLVVGANDKTTTGIWIQPLKGPARRVALGKVVASSAFWVDMSVAKDGAIAFTGSEPLHPPELYYVGAGLTAPARLTDFNDEVAALALGKTETIEWDGPDGYKPDGVVTYPPDFAPGRKYPLALYIHGGPTAASKEAFSARAQLFAAQGWIVFEPNYRGSDNRGSAFEAAIWNDAGAGPGRDVMSGVEVLKKRGIVDEARMTVSGWSYGGYMTVWMLGHYPNLWRAAVAGAAVTDLSDQYNLGDANVLRGESIGGSPWKDGRDAAYREQSPITEAHRIRAPTLVMSNLGDFRVTVTQSFKLYHALKDNGVETRFVAYPIPGHNAGDPVRQRDVARRWLAWLSEHLNGGAETASGSTR
jgi:dipeptidyl aminopeptidase/acylaminoacyl peptidase